MAPRLALILLFYLRIKRGGRRTELGREEREAEGDLCWEARGGSVWGSRLILDLGMEKRGRGQEEAQSPGWSLKKEFGIQYM